MLEDSFMLEGLTATNLYNNFAKECPIYDFHCHLSCKDIYEDKMFNNISEIFLKYDHYKWRAMRYAGIDEKYITGNADDFEKFKMWAKTCEKLIGSPLYHWTNLELKKYFGVHEMLNESNCEKIYNICNEKIKANKLSPIKFINQSNVKLICTTDDPCDDLKYHELLAVEKNIDFRVIPTFRPDKAIDISKDNYIEYINLLSKKTRIEINSYDNFLKALKSCMKCFNEVGCKISDHSLESLMFFKTNKDEIESIFNKRIKNIELSYDEVEKFKSYTLKILASEYHKRGWIMQLHIGAMRNNNEIMLEKSGVDSGFDSMNDFNIALNLAKILNDINKDSNLPKTIIYTLNPKDNIVISTLAQCFTENGIAGKVQFGAAWWFNDYKDGIYEHLKLISSQGMMAYFVGMVTDSRSFLSYIRHDYFRRILCSFIGRLIDNNEFEYNPEVIKEIIQGICFENIKKYLDMEG